MYGILVTYHNFALFIRNAAIIYLLLLVLLKSWFFLNFYIVVSVSDYTQIGFEYENFAIFQERTLCYLRIAPMVCIKILGNFDTINHLKNQMFKKL